MCNPAAGAGDDAFCVCQTCAAGRWNGDTGFESEGGAAACRACPFPKRCTGGASCEVSFDGLLCGACAKTYYAYDETCLECPKVPWGVIVMCALGIVGAFAFTKLDTRNWMIVAALKQLVNFSQNVNITDLISIAWPKVYKQIMTVFKYFSANLESTSPECYADFNWHVRYVGNVSFFFALFLLCFAGIKLTAGSARWFNTNQRLKRAVFFFFSAAYASLATICVKSFMQTEGYFTYDPSIDYYGTAHRAVMVSAGIVLALCLFGMPIGFARFTRALLKSDCLRHPAVKNAYGSIYDAYKPVNDSALQFHHAPAQVSHLTASVFASS